MFPDIQAEFSYHTHFTHIDTLLLDFTPSTEPGIGKLILGGVEREDALRNLGYLPKLLRSPGIIFGCSLSKNVHNSKTAGCMILTQRYTKMLGRTSNRGLHSNLLLFSSLFTFFLLSDMVKKTTCQIWIWSFSNPALILKFVISWLLCHHNEQFFNKQIGFLFFVDTLRFGDSLKRSKTPCKSGVLG